MRRLAGCLVISLLASTAIWVGCRDDGEADVESFAVAGSGTDAMTEPGTDVMTEPGPGSDAVVEQDAIAVDDVLVLTDVITEPAPDAMGSGSDAMTGSDAISTEPGPDAITTEPGPDAMTEPGPDAMTEPGSDAATTEPGVDADDRGDARRGAGFDPSDRTSFYACAGGGASTGVEVGLPIGLTLLFAIRRRRRWNRS